MNMSLDLRWFGVLLLSFAFLCSNQCKKIDTCTKYGNAYSLTSYAKDDELSTVSNVNVTRQGKMDNDDNKALNTKAVSDNNLPYQRPLPPLPVVGKPNQNNSSVSGIGNSPSIVSSRGGSEGYVSNEIDEESIYEKIDNYVVSSLYDKTYELITVNGRQTETGSDDEFIRTIEPLHNNLQHERPLPPLPVVDKPNQNNSSVSGIGNSLSIVSSRGGSEGYVSNEIDEESIYEKIDNYVVSSLYDKTYELITVNGRQTETGSDDEFIRTIEPLHNNLQHERPLLPLPVVDKPNQNNSSVSGIYSSFNKRVVIPDPDYAWLEGTRHDNSGPYFLRIPPVPPRPTRRSSNRKMNFSSVTRKIKIWLPLKGLIQRSRR